MKAIQPRPLQVFLFLALLVFSTQCQTWEDFGSYRKLSATETPGKLKQLSPRIAAEECSYPAFIVGFPETSAALKKLNEQAPEGTTGFQALEIKLRSSIILTGYVCVNVSGIPVQPE